MAYEARHDSGGQAEMTQDERNIKNNTENLRNAADVAIATKNPYAMAAGAIVKAADKITGGKSTEFLGKTLNTANKITPGGKRLQKGLNDINESGVGDKVGQAARMKNMTSGGGGGAAGAAGNASKAADAADKAQKAQQVAEKAQKAEETADKVQKAKGGGGKKQEEEQAPPADETQESSTTLFGKMNGGKILAFMLIPSMAFIFFIVAIFGAVGGSSGEFEEAFGAADATGGDTGGMSYTTSDPKAKAFYERINEIKLEYQSNGKTVDAITLVAVYHVINVNNGKYDYDYMTKARLKRIANAMFQDNIYSEETFRENLKNDIFPSYFPNKDEKTIEEYTEDVFEYVKNYNSIIGNGGTVCAASGTCVYTIKGFRINNNAITKELNVNNLMVRLMQCGSPYGKGSYTTPINQDLVPFEEYAAGVAYAEVGGSAHIEVLKAQIVMARSFALARPTAMGNSAGKKLEEENGKWVLQISSCVADQVFCNINEGCTYTGGGDGQGGYVISGVHPDQSSGEFNPRQALPQDHNIRVALSETLGEVLVDNNGYIISTSYTSTTQNKLASLAKQGYNYKQMLLEVYNSDKPLGAADIQKMQCNKGENVACGMVSTGPYASWKQIEGPWINVPMGNSGKTIRQIGCLATSVSILIAKSGVPTVIQGDFNPGTFVQFLNANGGFVSGGNFVWASVSKVAPTFRYQGQISVSGYSRAQKLNKISELLKAGYYVVAEVKGSTGQHWVAIDTIQGNNVVMMDPASHSSDMWSQYPWYNTSTLAYFSAG